MNEDAPLLKSTDSVSYGIISPSPEDDTDDGGDDVSRGCYTPGPVGHSFSKSADLKPKPVWQLPHKDYDVSFGLRERNLVAEVRCVVARHTSLPILQHSYSGTSE